MKLLFSRILAVGWISVALAGVVQGQTGQWQDRLEPFFTEDEVEIRRAEPVSTPPPAPPPSTEPEIRRAEPVPTPPPPTPTPTPADPEIRRALPVTPPPAAPPGLEMLPGYPVPGQFPTPQPTPPGETAPAPTPETPTMAAPEPVEIQEEELTESVIRIAPAEAEQPPTPDKVQIDLANGFYSRELYDLAAPEYRRYLEMFPRGPDREAAYFRLSESFRHLGRRQEAISGFENLLADFPYGEFVGPAAYRLAELYYLDQNYRAAIPLFRRAAASIDDERVKLAARFFEAQALERLDRSGEARLLYEQIAESPESNPYRDYALLAVARADQDRGRYREALRALTRLAREATQPQLRREAAVKAGLLAVELDDAELALPLLQETLDDPEAAGWHSTARIALMRLYREREEHAKVLELYGDTPGRGEEHHAEAMLLAANAYRHLGEFETAAELYDQIQREHPGTQEAEEARYQHVVILYSRNDPATNEAADHYLLLRPEGERADRVRLIKAERYFRENDFESAAELYRGLIDSELPREFKTDVYYKLAWSEARLDHHEEAVRYYSQFMVDAPEHNLFASALAQRGLSLQKLQRFDEALNDFQRIGERFAGGSEHELALQQAALIHGQREERDQMAAIFTELLEVFPETQARSQAHYWIGWAAFESRNYAEALEDLNRARELNPDSYGERAGMRVMLSYYYLQDVESLRAEVDRRLSAENGSPVPREVLRWLGLRLHEDADYEGAARYLARGLEETGPEHADLLFILGEVRLKTGDYAGAKTALEPVLKETTDPSQRARALLIQARADLQEGRPEVARETVREILMLQPEGRLNAEARFLTGQIEMAEGDYAEAGRSFMSVAVLYDDRELTPRALEEAISAYRKAGDAEQSARILDELRTRFPEHPLSEVMRR